VFLARKGAMRTLEAGVTTVRDLGADQYMDIAMRDLINRGEMIGPRMFVCGYGLYVTNTPYKAGLNPLAGGIADGVPEVLKVVRQQIAAGADVIKLYGSTGTDDDVTGFETYTYEEMKAAWKWPTSLGKKIAIHSYGPDGARMRYAQDGFAGTRDGHGRCHDSGDGEARNVFMCRRSTITATTSKTATRSVRGGIQGEAASLHPKESGDGTQGIQGGCEICDGFGCNLHDVWQNTRELGVCESRNDAGAGAPHGDDQCGGAAG